MMKSGLAIGTICTIVYLSMASASAQQGSSSRAAGEAQAAPAENDPEARSPGASGDEARSPVATAPATVTTAPAASRMPAEPIFPELDLSFDLSFEGSFDRRRVRYDRRGWFGGLHEQTNRSHRFEESVGLEASGVLFDPKWANFDLNARWGLSQEWFVEDRSGYELRESPDGNLLEYDISFNILPRGKISATAFAQRLDSRVPRAFQPSLERSLERYGATLLFNDATLPMRLTFEHTWDELTSRTRTLRDDEQRGRDTLSYEATWQIAPDHALKLEYEYDDRREEYSGSDRRFDTNRHYLTLTHTLRFGKDKRSYWENLARLQEERGELGRDMTELSSRLRLQHTDDFATNYAVQYLRDAFQELKTETFRGEAGFSWEMIDGLTTSVQAYGFKQNADKDTDFVEWGGFASINYQKDNPFGTLTANLTYNHNNSDTRDGDRRGIVVAESVTLRDPLLAYLVHPDIDGGSIVVTNATRTRTYLPARDYLIIRLGRYTALRRVATGQITDRETVLVSYTYRVSRNYDYRRDRVDIRVQQAFEFGLTPYYAASIQNEDVDQPKFVTFRARNVNRHRVGATYRQRRWSVGMEYEYNDDAIDPYEAVHANGDVVLWQTSRQQLDGRGNVSRFWFDGSDGLEARNTTLVDLGLAYRYVLARDLEASAAALYRFEDDSLFGRTNGVDLSAALDWKIGFFALRFEAEYDVLDLPGSREDGFAFWLKLRREIPLLARAQR